MYGGDDHCPGPAGHTISNMIQDVIGLARHLGTLLAHVHPAVDQHPLFLFCQSAFQLLFTQPAVLHEVVVTQAPSLGLPEPHIIGLGTHDPTCPDPSAEPACLLADKLSYQLAKSAELPRVYSILVQIIDKDIEQDWPQN
ncbi:hypothetical protein BTVI_30735 [Pitangus sulphuratus]|nr:hypothetical protein BTVI_30735 [Pitangus sulphuratus]